MIWGVLKGPLFLNSTLSVLNSTKTRLDSFHSQLGSGEIVWDWSGAGAILAWGNQRRGKRKKKTKNKKIERERDQWDLGQIYKENPTQLENQPIMGPK